MDKVRIGFVGAGTMGQMAHLRNYVTLDDCEVVALADPRQETARRVAARYGVGTVYADHAELLAREDLDGVVATQPFVRHASLLPEIFPAVKCLFTEKPLALTVEAGERLAHLAAEAGCTHMLGYHKRSDPAVMHARAVADEWLDSGEMGALRYVRITMPPGEWIQGGFTELIDAGDPKPEGACEPLPTDMPEEAAAEYTKFVNYYIHQINLMRHFLGEPYTVAYADRSGVLLAVESESGVCGTIEMAPYRTTIEWEESVLVGFEKGYIRVRVPAPIVLNQPGEVEICRDPGGDVQPTLQRPSLPWVHAMRQQAIHFVRVCRGEMPPPCDAAEAVEDLKNARQYVDRRWRLDQA